MSGAPFRRERRPWPAEVDRDVAEELASHLAEQQDEYIARGLDPAAAAAAAASRFGDREAIADACRRIDRTAHHQERRRHMLADLRQDAAYALRALRRSPGFAAIAVLTLALGIGATTTIFTLANWALLRPVPGVRSPKDVSVFWVGRKMSEQSFRPSFLSYPNLTDVVARLKTVSLGAYQGGTATPVAGSGQAPRVLSVQFVTSAYFDVLGVRMQVGRPFTAAEDTPPSPFLGAVISDRLWQSMFQRDPNVIRQTLEVAGVRFAILGVAAPGFHGTERISLTDLWLPGAASPIVRHMKVRYDARTTGGYYELVARLRPGATWTQAQAELESLRAWLHDEYPRENEKFAAAGFHLMGPIGPPPFGAGLLTKIVGLAAGSASALVLLIACANVAGLLLVRAVGRRGEIGIRKALGAARSRLVRQHVVEGTLLWLLGGVAALAIVALLNATMPLASLIGVGGLDLAPSIDWRVLSFSAVVSLVVGLLSSLEPAMRATRAEAAETLRAAGPAATKRSRAGTTLAVLQMAASLTLLVGAYLLAGTLAHLSGVPLGFEPDGLFVFPVQPASVGYTDAASLEYLNELQQRLKRIPGVHAVAAANGAPFVGGANMVRRIRVSDATSDSVSKEVHSNSVFSSSYFDALGIPLVRGRAFTDADLSAGLLGESRAVVISDNLAHRLFGTADPVGRGLEFGDERGGQRYDIVGVAGTARYRDLVTPAEDMVYLPAGPKSMGIAMGATVIVRTDGSVALARQASAIATALNPALPLMAVIPMSDAVARARSEWYSLALIITVLTSLATVLACVGLYGVVAHGVAERRREMGIRLALGATNTQVRRLVLRHAATITGAGIAIGLAGAYAFARMLSTRLVGVDALDPVLWSLATMSLVAVAGVASIVPMRAATRVDVVETLRSV